MIYLFVLDDSMTRFTMRAEELTKCYEPLYVKRYKQAKIRKRRNQKKIPTPKTEVGKNQTNNQVLIP